MTDVAANGDGEESDFRAENTIDLARRLRKAALRYEPTQLPQPGPTGWICAYGEWKFRL
jgi:hypothetical protein